MIIGRDDLNSALMLATDGTATAEENKKELTPCCVASSSETCAPHHVRMFLNQQANGQSKEAGKRALVNSEPWITIWQHNKAKENRGSGFLYGGGGFSLGTQEDSKSVEDMSPEQYGLQNVRKHGGANVYIRSKEGIRLGFCLNRLSGHPLGILQKASSNDDIMWRLWQRAPHAVLAGLIHAFYRPDTIAWLAQQTNESARRLGACAGIDCKSTSWVMAAAAFSKDLLALDEPGCGVSVPREILAVRSVLCDLVMQGLLFGPLRSSITEVREIGLDFENNAMWFAAAKAKDGSLYFLPRSHFDVGVLKLNTLKGYRRLLRFPPGYTHEMTAAQPAGFLYSSAVLGPDNCIYGIPGSALRVLRIDPFRGDEITFLGDSDDESSKWGQGVLCSYDNNIYCAPCNAKQVLQINFADSSNPTVTKIGRELGTEFGLGLKWWGAAFVLKPKNDESLPAKICYCGHYDPNNDTPCNLCNNSEEENTKGFVYFTPHNAHRVLQLDPDDPSSINEVGTKLSPLGGEKFYGACVCDGVVVASPGGEGAQKVLVFDPSEDESNLIRPNLEPGPLKWIDTVLGLDEAAYGLVHSASKVIRIEPKEALQRNLKAIEDLKAAKEKETKAIKEGKQVEGLDAEEEIDNVEHSSLKRIGKKTHLAAGAYGCGVLGNDGYVYAAPTSSRVLRIDTFRQSLDPAKGEKNTMLWLWRARPELWFRFFCHPLYNADFLHWFEDNSGAFDRVGNGGSERGVKTVISSTRSSSKKDRVRSSHNAADFALQCGIELIAADQQRGKDAKGLRKGDKVRIQLVSEHEAKISMEGYGDWKSSMRKLLGQYANIEAITSRGGIRVLGHVWSPALIVRPNSTLDAQKITAASHPWHRHGLVPYSAGGWFCDGRSCPGGCRGMGGGSGTRFRCTEGCDFDLCGPCFDLGNDAPTPFRVDDIVRIKRIPISEAKKFARQHGGWKSGMLDCLGSVGRITHVDYDNDVRVRNYFWNPNMIEGYLKVGDVVKFQVSDVSAEWKGCPGPRLIFRAGVEYKVHSLSAGGFFTSSRFKYLYAPISAVVPPEVLSAAVEGRLRVGEQVQLTEGYTSYVDAADSPLKPGDVATLLQDDESVKPFKVTFNEKTWYYEEGALRRATELLTAGEVVRVNKIDVVEAKRLAEGHGGWTDSREEALLGSFGKMECLTDSGDVRVFGRDWNPAGESSWLTPWK